MQGLKIGQLASLAGIGVETVRFYERRGLLGVAARRASGYRIFPEQMVRRLLFIRHAKALGFTLTEIGELLALRAEPMGSCAEIQILATSKLETIDQRIDALQRMRQVLFELTRICPGSRAPRSECPILDALESAKENHVAV